MAKFVAPDLTNATPEFLVDEMGKLSAMESQVKKLRAFYKEAYFARTGIDPDTFTGSLVKAGETFTASTTSGSQNRFNQESFQADHPDMFEKYKRELKVVTTRFSLNAGVVNPIVNELLEQLKRELNLD